MHYKSTRTTVYSAKYHIVWCPKYRRAILTGHLVGRPGEPIGDEIGAHGGEVIEYVESQKAAA